MLNHSLVPIDVLIANYVVIFIFTFLPDFKSSGNWIPEDTIQVNKFQKYLTELKCTIFSRKKIANFGCKSTYVNKSVLM